MRREMGDRRIAAPVSLCKRMNYAVAHTVVRWLIRPTTPGMAATEAVNTVYVLKSPSLTDLIALDLVAQRLGAARPMDALLADGMGEAHRFFFLNRGGLRRRPTREHSKRMRRIEHWLLNCPDAEATLIPVSVFWGRAGNKDRSLLRSLFSDDWSVTSRFRRFMSLFFNRTDILVQFATPIPWHDIIDPGMDPNRLARRTARLVRVKLRNQRTATLGPDLSHRGSLVTRILRSEAVRSVVEASEEKDASARLARRYANDIASELSYPGLRLFNGFLTWFWHRIYAGIEVRGIDRFSDIAETHTLVYAPSHRSHIDYLVLSYALFHAGLMPPHIAAGENLNMPLIGPLLRRGGAFFMRRRFADDPLYTAVFSEYLHQVLWRGHSVEYFIEGGRSRTGRLLHPRTGMLRMTIRSHRRGVLRPIAIVPVHIGYEKLVEAGAYLDELRGQAKPKESIRNVVRNLRLVRQSFGKVALDFAAPIQLAAFASAAGANQQEDDDQLARALGVEVLARINAVASINAINLVALVTLSMPRHAIDERLALEQIDCLRDLLTLDADHHAHHVTPIPARDILAHVESLGMLDRDIHDFGDILSHDAFTAVRMTWYRNNALPVFAVPALIACLLVNRRRRVRGADLARYFHIVFPHMRAELYLEAASDDLVPRWLSHLAQLNLVTRHGDDVYAPPPRHAPEHFRLRLLANIVMQTIERYYIVGALLTRHGTMTRGDLEGECGIVARRMSKIYGINAPDFFDAALFRRFIETLIERGAAVESEAGDLTAAPILGDVVRGAQGVINDEFRHAVSRPRQ